MKRYIVGYVRENDTPMVRLQEIDKHGKYIGDAIDSPGFQINGILRTSEFGQVVLQDDNDKTKPVTKSGGNTNNNGN